MSRNDHTTQISSGGSTDLGREPGEPATRAESTAMEVVRDGEFTGPVADDDVRGLLVADLHGSRAGGVGALVLDAPEGRARLLLVDIFEGGVTGDAAYHVVPVEAVRRVADEVRLAFTRADVADGPSYRSSMTTAADFLPIYRYYGYQPFWEDGYTAHYFHDRGAHRVPS